MKKPTPPAGQPAPGNNHAITTGPCQPDHYLSQANKAGYPCRSILAANVDARLQEKAASRCFRLGGPYEFLPQQVEDVRRRYRTRMYDPGMATYDKSKDGIY